MSIPRYTRLGFFHVKEALQSLKDQLAFNFSHKLSFLDKHVYETYCTDQSIRKPNPAVNSSQEFLSEHSFRSSFKSWVRTVALIIVIVFVPEQISWAFNYDPYVVRPDKAKYYVSPYASEDELSSAKIANSVENLLRQVAYREKPQIHIRLQDYLCLSALHKS